MQLQFGLNDLPDSDIPLYYFNKVILFHELNFQKRIYYRTVNFPFLCWLFSCFLTEYMERGRIDESVFRSVFANEIYICLRAMDFKDKDYFITMLKEKFDQDAESCIAEFLGREREEELADRIVDPIYFKIIEEMDYYVGLSNSYNDMVAQIIVRENAKWN